MLIRLILSKWEIRSLYTDLSPVLIAYLDTPYGRYRESSTVISSEPIPTTSLVMRSLKMTRRLKDSIPYSRQISLDTIY
jgi:hypothetical protein